MAYNNPAVADFKNRFVRDFPYSASDPTLGVLDADIAQAFVDTNPLINPCLFDDQGSYTNAYLYLAADRLICNMRMASTGLASGAFSFLVQSKSAGALAQAYAIPQRILDNPEFAMLCTTPHGARYLALVLPQLCGQVFFVAGTPTVE